MPNQNARRLRRDSTDTERRLWAVLRDRRLAGFKFRRQVAVGGYILDFYCVRAKLAIELDGGQHSEGEAVRYDNARTAKLAELGVKVIRFWDCDVLKFPDAVKATVYRAVMEGTCELSAAQLAIETAPSPGTPGEGGGEGFCRKR